MAIFKADAIDHKVHDMNGDDIGGTWIGAYSYGDTYPEPIRGKQVAFEINIAISNGLVNGDCTDEEATPHFKQPALIEGAVHGHSISFIKRYPYYWQQEENGPRFLPKMPSQEVYYSGEYNNGQFEGEWEISTELTDAEGNSILYKGVGNWYMKKLQL
jgi:hypothetical protein